MRHLRLRCARGQASIEWLVVVGVVLAALVVTGVAAGSPQIAGVVVRQFRRALCIVSRGDCNEDRAACVLTSHTYAEASSISLLVIKVSDTTQVLVEQLSDGTWRVTHLHDAGGGLDVGVGADLSLAGLGLKLAIGGDARASVLAHLGHGETWLARTAAEKRLLVTILSLNQHPSGQPAQRFGQSGTLLSAQATVGSDGIYAANGQYLKDDVDGTRTDTASGRTTTYIRTRDDLSGTFQMGGLITGISLGGAKSTQYALTYDRSGRPVDFEVLRVGQNVGGLGGAGFNRGAAELPASISYRRLAGKDWESEEHLDLADPDNLAAATAFIKAIRDPSADIGGWALATRAINARLAADGTDQLRVYSLHRGSTGASGHVSAGIKVGGSYSETTTDMHLDGAQVRGPDGIWTRRDDCLDSA